MGSPVFSSRWSTLLCRKKELLLIRESQWKIFLERFLPFSLKGIGEAWVFSADPGARKIGGTAASAGCAFSSDRLLHLLLTLLSDNMNSWGKSSYGEGVSGFPSLDENCHNRQEGKWLEPFHSIVVMYYSASTSISRNAGKLIVSRWYIFCCTNSSSM